MQLKIIKKRFLLAGYETAIDFSKDFTKELLWVRSELKRSLERIGNRTEDTRLIGFWQPWQARAETPNPSKAKYFFGVEILNINDIPSDCVIKAIPESEYAVYREERRGTAPKAEICAAPGLKPNYSVAGDFEIFDDFDRLSEDEPCDILIPVTLQR